MRSVSGSLYFRTNLRRAYSSMWASGNKSEWYGGGDSGFDICCIRNMDRSYHYTCCRKPQGGSLSLSFVYAILTYKKLYGRNLESEDA